METSTFKHGDLAIVHGTPVHISSELHRDRNWKVDGYRTVRVDGTGQFSTEFVTTEFTPASYLKPLPVEWTAVIGGGLEERWTWNAGHTRMTRELRRVAWYVSVINGESETSPKALLLGPLRNQAQAVEHLPAVRAAAAELDPFFGFARFGTARMVGVDGEDFPAGKLNHRIEVPA